MKYERQLLALVARLGYIKPDDVSTSEFMNKKETRLYKSRPEFKQFLDKHTSFLPSYVDSRQRWYYFLDGAVAPRLCPVCNAFIKEYRDKYCCHACSTKDVKTGAKTGPKVDLVAQSADIRKRLKIELPEYKLISYTGRKNKAVFKHKCGTEFQMHVRPLLEGSGSCSCLHKKLVLHDKASLQQWHDEHQTGYVVVKYDHTVVGNKDAVLKCSNGHKFTARKFYASQCERCVPDRLATQKWLPEQYAKFIKKRQPRFQLLDTYVDSETPVRFRHKDCGHVFSTVTPRIARPQFRCPACSPRTCGSYRKVVKNGREIKLRGKEHIALDWILEHDKFDLKDIEFDSERTIPKFRYSDGARTQGYEPDMFVRSKNLLIEVKDLTSLGLTQHSFFYVEAPDMWKTNCAKALACLKAGYKFRMMLFDKNNVRIILPKQWYLMTHKQIKRWRKEL